MLAPFTSVHPQETTATPIPTEDLGPAPSPPTSVHMDFRHSFWRDRRTRTFTALSTARVGLNRLKRFESCGQGAWIQQSDTNPPRYRIRSIRCHDRLCEACAREKRNLLATNLYRALPPGDLRLLTFTLKAYAAPLVDQIARITHAFRRFRSAREIKPLITGGVYFLEVTYNSHTDLWHPHLHVICAGKYVPHPVAKRIWHNVTGDSFIVDLKPIRNPKIAASYVTKYAAKAIGISVWNHPAALAEAALALQHTRTFNTFGTFRDLALTKHPQDDAQWIDLAPLSCYLLRAQDGDPIARWVVGQLRRHHDAIDNPPAPET